MTYYQRQSSYGMLWLLGRLGVAEDIAGDMLNQLEMEQSLMAQAHEDAYGRVRRELYNDPSPPDDSY